MRRTRPFRLPRALWACLLLAGLAVGCGGSKLEEDPWTKKDGGPPADAQTIADTGPLPDVTPVVTDKVYAHSSSVLFEIDPNTLQVTTVGSFGWPSGYSSEQMTDIAIDELGNMIGISFYHVFSVNKETAACTHLAPLQAGLSGFNGLSWVEGVGADPNGKALVGVNQSGDYYTIDPTTGQSTRIGAYGSFGSSGDLVYVRGAGTFATATSSSHSTDVLVAVNAGTGQATLIGETGFSSIWGLAYWGGEIYGFTDFGEFINIDPASGQGTLVEATSYSFWGAGVTTTAPIVQ